MPAVATCVVILRRRREWAGGQRLFWDAFLVGLILWALGHIGWAFGDLVLNRARWVQWHTMFSLCGGMGPLVALIARPHRGVREEAAAATAVDLISYAMLGGFIYAYFVLVPSVLPARGAGAEGTMLTLVQIHRLLLVMGMAGSAFAARHTVWFPTYVRLTIGVSIGFVLRATTSLAIASGSYHSGTVFDLAWIVPFLTYLWAAVEAPPSPRPNEVALETGAEPGPAVLSAIPVLLIPVTGYGLLRLEPLGDPGDSFRVLLTTMTTVCGIGLLTLRLAIQRGELRRADARLKLLAAATEQTGDLILITHADGLFAHANEACVRALGYSRDELVDVNLSRLLDHADPDNLRDSIGREVRQKGIWRGTVTFRRRDGSTLPVASTVVALRNSTGAVTHFVGVQRDITDELRLRDQLVHSERMSAVGELVAGVAHEINNPLQTIVGCVELLLDESGSREDQRRDLQLVRQEAARAGQIVRNLLAFVRRGSPDRVSGDVNQLVRATVELREYHLTQRNITLVTDLHPAPLPVVANREEIQQVVLNLLMNAEQAIADGPGNGTIVVRTRPRESMQTLQVSDDGPGISAELRGRIFEPFFTTKDVGQGTGLGLSISLGIATSHGGALTLVESRRGACFELALPRAQTTEARPASKGTPNAARQCRVLIVEDEEPVRGLLQRLLARRGLDALGASSFKEAAALVERDSLDLVLCDVSLGDASGVTCFRHVRAVRPALARRFVFITGNTGSVGGDPDVADVPVLAKPFTAEDLDRVLANLSSLIPDP